MIDMATLDHMLDRGDSITERARQVKFSRVMVILLTGVFFALGWVTAKVFTVLWFGLVWGAMAVADGWAEGRKRKPPLH